MLVRLADGEAIASGARRAVTILAARPELTVTWSRYVAGEHGPDLHVHREHTDAFYVLEGELTFVVGPEAERVLARAGAFVAVPPNVVHTFINSSSADTTWLNFHAPDTGFAAYLRAARAGSDAAWDSFDPPADGGRSAAEAVVSGPGAGVKCVLPELFVAELDGPGPREDLLYELHDGRVLSVRAPA
jgi:mannose-6-phosphate isomerase-like protein (cupin superfamily)